MPEQWSNFFVMVGSGAAALAGLIFVAMSINHQVIIGNKTHKNRAINMLSGLRQFSWQAVSRSSAINIPGRKSGASFRAAAGINSCRCRYYSTTG